MGSMKLWAKFPTLEQSLEALVFKISLATSFASDQLAQQDNEENYNRKLCRSWTYNSANHGVDRTENSDYP